MDHRQIYNILLKLVSSLETLIPRVDFLKETSSELMKSTTDILERMDPIETRLDALEPAEHRLDTGTGGYRPVNSIELRRDT